MAWPRGCHRVGVRFARKPGLCSQFPVLSPAPSLPSSWFASSLNEVGWGVGRGAKAVPSTAGALGFPQGQAAGRCHSGRTLLSRLAVPSSGHKTSSVPFQNSPAATYVHLGIFTPSLCQQLNVLSGELGIPPCYLPPLSPSACGTAGDMEPGSAASPRGDCSSLGGPVSL